jgi:SAM-dependent methyltransferase
MKGSVCDSSGARCIVCGSQDVVEILRMPGVPTVCNKILPTAQAARQQTRASIDLVGCCCCGHVFNAVFDPGAIAYDGTYENSLMNSARYREYTIALVARLLSRYRLLGGSVVEIGCGRGEFLRLLCEVGMRRATGFDPGRTGETAAVGDARVEIVGAAFAPALAPAADLVCSRHVLEHLPHPTCLLETVAQAYSASPPQVLFVEVPNGDYTIEQFGIWDLIYEHVSYFTPSSLEWALRYAGFSPIRVEAAFGGQFLVAEARLSAAGSRAPSPDLSPDIPARFQALRVGFVRMVAAWEGWLNAARQNRQRLALWGAGSKGVTFLNLLDAGGLRAIGQVIDINPRKAGAFTAGTGHPIAQPATLRDWRPDAILLMNPEYEAEVREVLAGLGIDAELIPVSSRLPPLSMPTA